MKALNDKFILHLAAAVVKVIVFSDGLAPRRFKLFPNILCEYKLPVVNPALILESPDTSKVNAGELVFTPIFPDVVRYK